MRGDDDVEGVKHGTRNVFEHYLGEDPAEWDDLWRKQITDDEQVVIEVDVDAVTTKR